MIMHSYCTMRVVVVSLVSCIFICTVDVYLIQSLTSGLLHVCLCLSVGVSSHQ